MHKLQQLIKQVNKTHKGLGPLIAINILAAKAKKTILNVAPADCGKSTAESLISTVPYWCWIKTNSPKHIIPTDKAKEILNLCGANQKW